MTYKVKKGKYVICKDDVYFALTEGQVYELFGMLFRIIYDLLIKSARRKDT